MVAAGNNPSFHLFMKKFARDRLARRFERYLKSGSGREFAKRHFAQPHGARRIAATAAGCVCFGAPRVERAPV